MLTIQSPFAVWISATILASAALAVAEPAAAQSTDISARVIERPSVTAPIQPGPERAAKTPAIDPVIDNDTDVGDFSFNEGLLFDVVIIEEPPTATPSRPATSNEIFSQACRFVDGSIV